MWTENTVPEAGCPLCGHRIDRASSPGGTAPKPGDIAVCICCTAALVFDGNLQPREMSRHEIAGLDPSARNEMRLYQYGIRMFISGNKHRTNRQR
jgi:hypothetical protein